MHGGYVCTVLCSEITGACLLPLSQQRKLTAVYGRWFKFIRRLYDRLLWVFCSLGIIVIGPFISKKHNYAFPLIRPPMKNRHSTTDFVLDMEIGLFQVQLWTMIGYLCFCPSNFPLSLNDCSLLCVSGCTTCCMQY